MVVVIRYFGGTKLGVGPLGKAYYESAFNVLKSSQIIVKNPFQQISVTTNFDKMGHVFRLLSTFNAKKVTSDYKENLVDITCLLIANDIPAFQDQIQEFSQGDIEIKISDKIIYL
jgi:putative IMPACT (imprinted ancient) family translation regulator